MAGLGVDDAPDSAFSRLPVGISTFLETGGVTLHVRRDGNRVVRPPTLVYLHSLGSELRIWDQVVARLPDHNHLLLDQRGHGLSDAPPGPYDMAQLADDVFGVLEVCGLKRVVAVGVSIGAMIAMRLALRRPSLVAALVLCDTAGKVGDSASWDGRITTVRENGLAAMAGEVLARWFPPAFRTSKPEAVRGYANMLSRTAAEGYVASCFALREEDLRPRLAELTQPTLVLCGSQDGSTPPELVRAFAAALPSARYHEVAGAGHLPCLDAPEVVAESIAEFLGSLPRRPG